MPVESIIMLLVVGISFGFGLAMWVRGDPDAEKFDSENYKRGWAEGFRFANRVHEADDPNLPS